MSIKSQVLTKILFAQLTPDWKFLAPELQGPNDWTNIEVSLGGYYVTLNSGVTKPVLFIINRQHTSIHKFSVSLSIVHLK